MFQVHYFLIILLHFVIILALEIFMSVAFIVEIFNGLLPCICSQLCIGSQL